MKIDLHMHTMVSKDTAIPVNRATVKYMKEKGLDGVAITDHDSFANAIRFSRLLEREGMIGIPGEEVKTPGGGEILCFFLNEEVKPGPWQQVIDHVHDQGGLAILAHPFDYLRGNWMEYFTMDNSKELEGLIAKIDGIEAFNARNYSTGANHVASKIAMAFQKAKTGGSDAHNVFEIGTSYTEIPIEEPTMEELRETFKMMKLMPESREFFPNYQLPSYKLQRFLFGMQKKLHSLLNRLVPPFKRWQVALHSQ